MPEPVPTPSSPAAAPEPPAGHVLALAWARANPLPAALAGILAATITFFYVAVPVFPAPEQSRHLTALDWIRAAWNPETHYEHGPLVPLIILFLVWHALPRLRGVRPAPTAWGLAPLLFGVALFLLSARALQPRFAWAGLPFMLYGAVLYAAGRRAARAMLFPILCVFFMIPVPGIDQGTVKLQVLATKTACLICNAIGLKMVAVGTSLHAVDESFQFQVIGDCSGINSLMAITLMTAVFAHLTQDRLWKKLRALRLVDPRRAPGQHGPAGVHHDRGQMLRPTGGRRVVPRDFGLHHLVSPFAFGALCVVNKLLNWRTATPSSPAARQVDRRRIPRCRGRSRVKPSAMITNRLLVLQAIILLGLGVVYLIPQKTGLGPAGIAMKLPDAVGEWKGDADLPVTPAWNSPGSRRTRSSRGVFYENGAGDKIYVSIVLSGNDMANSIHRPERCLAAQGWTVERAARVQVPLNTPDAPPLEVTRLTDEREARGPDGRTIPLRNLNYYWFIGSHDVTASHWRRTFIDVEDRVLRGENQRWAYVTVATNITENLQPGGRSATDTAELVENFIGRIVPLFEKP